MKDQIWFAAILASALCMPAAAADKSKPWEERTLTGAIDRKAIEGVLSRSALDSLISRGEALFTARFTVADGAGRPMATQAIIPTKRRRPGRETFQRMSGPDANACSSCHNEPAVGGGGSFTANVFVSEGFGNAEFDSTDPQFSNERNTNHMFGSGLVELLAREMTAELQAIRMHAAAEARGTGKTVTKALTTKGVSFGTITVEPDGMADLSGLDGVDTDLVIRPFSQKGVMTSLRQFTINALNHHHGIEATERFGMRWTGDADFDADGVADEIGASDVSALVAWQATLPPPVIETPKDPEWHKAASQGSRVFDAIGCNSCHVRALPLKSPRFSDPGPVDAAGTLRGDEDGPHAIYDLALRDWAASLERNDKGDIMVPLFGDLKRHRIADAKNAILGNELLAQRFVDRDVFMTAELWGIASTAPYGHRGDLTTLDAVIRAHGGEAAAPAQAYAELSGDERSSLIAFLKTLVIAP